MCDIRLLASLKHIYFVILRSQSLFVRYFSVSNIMPSLYLFNNNNTCIFFDKLFPIHVVGTLLYYRRCYFMKVPNVCMDE